MAYTTIDNPELYFQTKLYTGNGGTQSITLDGSENMQPDWVWIKSRNNSGVNGNHFVQDSVRGATKSIITNITAAEFTQTNMVTSFDSDGFSLGNEDEFNRSGTTFVSWNWKAGGSASSNSDGSITSSVSANQTAGFSIVSYSGNSTAGATIGHGLGVTPKMLIVRKRNTAENWLVYNEAKGNTGALLLNTTTAFFADSMWNNTSPTSSVFTVDGNDGANGSGGSYIAYCFADVKGYSKFGSYKGNGSSDGSYVFLGFKPAYVMIKQSSKAGEGWHIFDNKREGYNVDNDPLVASSANAEGTSDMIDLLSNGFKLRTDSEAVNESGETYIYMAFAENPFVTSTGIPTTAR